MPEPRDEAESPETTEVLANSLRMTLLQQREIEARVLGPLIRGFERAIGREQTIAVVREVISALARDAGAEMARLFGEASLTAFAGCLERWREDGSLEIEILRQDEEHLEFNVTRCRYAEMYHRLGLADLGSSLSCQRDFALVRGFNPEIHLTRTQTLMQGATHCDFRFRTNES